MTGSSCGGGIAGAALGCLIAGVLIGILLDMFVILRLRQRSRAAAEPEEPDKLTQFIVANPMETNPDQETFSNPAFKKEGASSASVSTASSGGSISPPASQAALTRKSSVQWPQWVSGGSSSGIGKQWRSSVGSSQDPAALEEGIMPSRSLSAVAEGSVTDTVAAQVPVPKKSGWLSSLFKKKTTQTKKQLLDNMEEARPSLPDAPTIIQENEMSAILDEVDQLARDIDGLHDTVPGKGSVPAALDKLDDVADAASNVTPLTAFGRTSSLKSSELEPSLGEVAALAAPDLPIDEAQAAADVPSIPNPDSALDDVLQLRPPQPLPKSSSIPSAASAPEVAVAAATAAAVAPKVSTKISLETKPSKLKSNPFLQTDRDRGSDFKRPSLKSTVSAKSSDSGDSKSPGVSVAGSVPGGLSAASQAVSGFSKVNLRKADLAKKPASFDAGSTTSPFHHAKSSLKRTVPSPAPASAPQPSKREEKPPPPLPEPLPTESQVDLEESDEMYVDPDTAGGPTVTQFTPSSAVGSLASPKSGSFPIDTTAVMETTNNYMIPVDDGSVAGDDYMEMADNGPDEPESYIDMGTTPSRSAAAAAASTSPVSQQSYLQLQDAVTGENNEYLDMSGSEPPPVAKRKISDSKTAKAKKPAKQATSKSAAKKAQKPSSKGGFFGRLFKSKKSAPAPAPAKPALPTRRLRPGWQRATAEKGAVKIMDEPAPAPPEWVQRLHQQGRRPSQYDDDDDIYEEYGQDGDMYEQLHTGPRQHTGDKIAKPSEGRALVQAEAKQQAIADLKSTPMPAGNVKRLTSHFVKKQG